MRRLGGLLLMLLLLAQVGSAFALGGAEPELDPSFGRAGTVHLEPEVPGYRESFPSALAGTRSGGFFALEDVRSRGCRRCQDWYLVRYGRSGSRDARFGYRLVAKGVDFYAYPEFSVDLAGRPLVAWKEGDKEIILRFTARGRPDATFGKGGRFVFRCGCYPGQLLPLPGGKLLLLSGVDNRPYKGSIPIFLRLRGDGTRDPSFGNRGVSRPRLHGREIPDRLTVATDGGIFFSGMACCNYGGHPYIGRLRKDGRIDRRFGRLARRALLRLPSGASFVFNEELIAHPDGHVDLMGGFEGSGGSFVLRLNRNGSRDASFGHKGMQRFGWQLLAAAGYGRDGAILDLNRFGTNAFYGLGGDGRLRGGLRLSIAEEEGPKIEAQPGNRIFVFDRGLWPCRQECNPQVRIYRLRLR